MDPIQKVVAEVLAKETVKALLRSLKEKELGKQLEPHLQIIKGQLSRIEAGIEHTHAMPLLAGIEFLRVGLLEEAKSELVRAVASDERGGVSRLLLAAVVSLDGKDELAEEYLLEALNVNPYLLSAFPVVNDHWARVLTVAGQERRNMWELSLNDSIRNFHNPSLWQSLFSDTVSEANICSASCCCGRLYLRWNYAKNFIEDKSVCRMLSCVDVSTGKVLWDLEVRAVEVLMASPSYVVLESPDEKERLRFLYAQDGRDAGSMTPRYFATVFCPNRQRVYSSADYQKFNTRFSSHEVLLRQGERALKARRKSRSFFQWLMQDLGEEPDFDFKNTDQKDLPGVSGLTLQNDWKYTMRDRSNGQSSSITTYRLNCSAKISFGRTAAV